MEKEIIREPGEVMEKEHKCLRCGSKMFYNPLSGKYECVACGWTEKSCIPALNTLRGFIR